VGSSGSRFLADQGWIDLLSGANGTVIRSWSGDPSGDLFGWSIAALGDINGDGVPDFVTSTPDAIDANGMAGGAFYVYSGADGSLLHEHLNDKTGNAIPEFGKIVANCGDFDGDGLDDFLIGSPNEGHAGRVIAFSSGTFAELGHINGDVDHEDFGNFVLNLGDVNGDGKNDILIGAPKYDGPPSGCGLLYTYSGVDGTLLWTVKGRRDEELGGGAGSFWRVPIAAIGDIDGDGVGDVALRRIGTLLRAEIRSGVDGSYIRDLYASDAYDPDIATAWGPRVDLDGDGDLDIVMHGSYDPSGAGNSEIRMFDPGTFDELARLDDLGGGSNFTRITSAGDLDGDHIPDLVLGMARYVVGINDTGGRVIACSFRKPPTVTSVTPSRVRFDRFTAVTILGSGFGLANGLTVMFGSQSATNVLVWGDQKITCGVEPDVPGPVDVTVADDLGSSTLANGFVHTPAVLIDGEVKPGATFTLRHLCDPYDDLLGIWGVPPPVSIVVPPFYGELAIQPFFVSFVLISWATDEFDLSVDLPNDPSLSGVQFLVQGLIGPQLDGRHKKGAWTNAPLLQIE
jgi:hypothetical protein